MADRDQVFISYSHQDTVWLDKLMVYLRTKERDGKIDRLSWDGLIRPGQKWYDEIQGYLDSAKVAVLLVSQSFLASEFIYREELPKILKAAEKKHLTLFWCLVRPCLYRDSPIWEYQAAHDPSRAWSELDEAGLDALLVKIADKLAQALASTKPLTSQPAGEEFSAARRQAGGGVAEETSSVELARAIQRLEAGDTFEEEDPFARARAILGDVEALDLIEQVGSLFVLRRDWPAAFYAYDHLLEVATPHNRCQMAVGYEHLGFIYQRGGLADRAGECWRLSRNLYRRLDLPDKAEDLTRLLGT